MKWWTSYSACVYVYVEVVLVTSMSVREYPLFPTFMFVISGGEAMKVFSSCIIELMLPQLHMHVYVHTDETLDIIVIQYNGYFSLG